MKKKVSKKLNLNRETLAPLRDRLDNAAGAGESFPNPCISYSCPWFCG